MVYNLLSCSGFAASLGSWIAPGACMKGRLGIVILFFLIAIIRKWGAEEWGIGFSLLFGLIVGIVPYFIVITLFGSFKIAFIVGLVGGLIGGYGAGLMFGGEGGEDYG